MEENHSSHSVGTVVSPHLLDSSGSSTHSPNPTFCFQFPRDNATNPDRTMSTRVVYAYCGGPTSPSLSLPLSLFSYRGGAASALTAACRLRFLSP